MAFNRKQKLRDNIEAIRTAFILDRENRTATTEERAILQRYCGFGGLKCILNPAKELTDAVGWAKSDLELFAPTVELHRLIRENSKDETEYKRFVDSLKASVLTFEKDLLTGTILRHLYPDQKMRTCGFEKIERPFNNYFDLAVSNIPFGDIAVFDAEFQRSDSFGRRSAQKTIHNYFFLKGLDAVRDGGIVAFITSQAAPAVTDTPSEAVGTFLFPDIEAEKPKEEVVDLSPRAYHRTPEMHLREGSLVADRGRHNIGYLKDITPYGAYVSLRDAYERLYRYESLRREANVPWREHLNTCYDEFVMRYGNLNAKQNVKLVMMDAGGRDILSLERMENGKFVKADIFEHPVSFAVESHANVGSPEEALSASLNKYGTVNLDYMREITDSTAEDLLTALQGRIYYNPLVTGYEIKDRFIAKRNA